MSSVICAGKHLVNECGPKELPVLMMLVDVTTKRGDWVGAVIDLASNTNYITHQAAKRLGLVGEPIMLVVCPEKVELLISTLDGRLAPQWKMRCSDLLCCGTGCLGRPSVVCTRTFSRTLK